MKRIICFLLILALVLPLWGCSGRIQAEAFFYYRRAKFQYGEENGVIDSEQRDITGHVEDLSFLISLYLMGPLDEELESPFPQNTRLGSVAPLKNGLHVELSPIDDSFTDPQFSLACACLALTCMELANVSEITITSGERSVTMDRKSLVLFDSITTETTEGG